MTPAGYLLGGPLQWPWVRQRWLGELLYYDAPAWVFTLGYSLFGLLVLWSWFKVAPR